MKLPGRRKDETQSAESVVSAVSVDGDQSEGAAARGTAPKGRPTPKRSAAAKRRGPVAPAPMTAAEARARRKALAGQKLSKEERRIAKAERRERMADRRERMLAGDESALLERDRGPVRRYVRDIVDARYNLLGLFMPVALGLMLLMMAAPQVQFYISPAMMLLMVSMGVDGVLVARKATRMVDAKFPNNVESRWKLGLYAASRASTLRRMRAPRPQVRRGERLD
ncbi:hypothetical protein AWC18_15435 [Mycolicibacter nonchromogenicus]|uniref:DUF3043 domain-containing protein n=1 Tax=Mycolicibacter nonchromogenicus TaxID=1782 RepID=A0A1X1Z6P2_MYCNO|nr:DUF3043 domain-containing protein [Mycolicibacter nonchromogenicus]OBI02746.1 hypothetical protein A5715_09510 [Mycolicibacter heraklionensis]ORW18920.1 hypothetical protein AWC18_15435 [Mycolicibacter nonchromogenicus]